MKRFGYLFDKIISIDNLHLASKNAGKRKKKSKEIIKWNNDLEYNIQKLHVSLRDKLYVVSEYFIFTIKEPKERIISKLPFRDRVVHHAIMIHLEPILKASFISQTYSCIKNRGIHKCLNDVRLALRDVPGTRYCLKLDIRKFYPSINNELLKAMLRTKLKDEDLLLLLNRIIDSTIGIPLGNFTSQWFGNFYLNKLDHWLKQDRKVIFFRYCDDMVILGPDKSALHLLRNGIEDYLLINLKLTLSNYQVFPVESRGIDFVGYKIFHTHCLLRKSIKTRFVKMIRRNKNQRSINSYKGWINHCNGKNLLNKYLQSA